MEFAESFPIKKYYLVGVPTLSPETSLRQLNIRVVGRDPQSAENKKHNWANTVFPNRQTPN